MSKFKNFGKRRENWGLQRALYWTLMHILRKYLGFSINYVTVGADLRRPGEIELPKVPEGYDTRVVGLTDLLPFVDTVPDFSKEFLEEAIARGDECGANFHAGKLVGFGFQCRTRAPVTEQLDVLVPPGFCYGYKGWIHPDHRRRNLSRMQGYVVFNTLPRPFEERSISYIETHNYPSLLHSYVHPRLRGLRTGYVGWVTLFSRQIPFNSRGAKRIGFEFVKKSDTRIRQYVR